MKYGSLITTSINIGDEIQSIASRRFLPHVDYLVHRERSDQFRSADGEKVKVIMNHFWLHSPKHFPPSDCIEPLFVSFHIKHTIRNDEFFTPKVISYFKMHEPIGCRDTSTVECLKSRGIDAYFTGCVTTTLLPNEKLKGKCVSDYILCVDIPPEAVEIVRKRTNKRVISISRMQTPAFSIERRFELAKFTLFLYHNADCVITSGLHVALPSTAFGVPVLMLINPVPGRAERFSGLDDLFHCAEVEDFISRPDLYDVNNPPENPEAIDGIREPLEKKCAAFTGFDSHRSVFEDDYNPTLAIAGIMPYDSEILPKMLMFAGKRSLLKAAYWKYTGKKDKHDF